MKFHVAATHFHGSADLLAELADAEFLDDDAPTTRDWPQWLGPHRDGVTTMPDLLKTWPERGPPRLWRKTSGETYSSFAVAEGRVYTTMATEGGETVFCWDLATGKERWQHAYTPRQAFQYSGPRTTPTLDGGKVYTLGAAGLLLCLNAADGKVVWEHDLAAELGAAPPRWGLACSPLVEGDRLFVAIGGRRSLAAFDKATGELVWAGLSDDPGYSSPVAATIDGARQVIFFTGTRLVGVAPKDGSLLWEYPWKTSFDVNAATPVVFRARSGGAEGTYVFISSGYTRGCGLVKVERRGGGLMARRVYESSELCCHFSTPVRHKDHIYAFDETRDLTCLDLRTGEVRWRFDRPEGAEGLRAVGYQKGSLLRVGELLLALGETGKLALVEATPEAYREVAAARPFRDRCWTLPVLAEGRLLVRDWKQVLCLDVRSVKD
ncbi:MAG: PQQ-binding-like beta-propeller repeat protein [Gemmataceae bacterium]